jgi:hypothetical protein
MNRSIGREWLSAIANLRNAGGAIVLVIACVLGGVMLHETVYANGSDSEMEVTDSRAIEIAREEATNRGLSTEDHEVAVQVVGEFWEVSFWIPNPGKLGGEGFVVRLRRPSGEFVDVRRFQ